MQPSSKGGMKVYTFDSGHKTEMAAMFIYGKNPKKNLLKIHCVDCLETLNVASLKSWVDRDLFYCKVKFGP